MDRRSGRRLSTPRKPASKPIGAPAKRRTHGCSDISDPQPSPTLGDALNAGYGYLEVRCLGCDTHQTVALDIVRRRKATPVHELKRYHLFSGQSTPVRVARSAPRFPPQVHAIPRSRAWQERRLLASVAREAHFEPDLRTFVVHPTSFDCPSQACGFLIRCRRGLSWLRAIPMQGSAPHPLRSRGIPLQGRDVPTLDLIVRIVTQKAIPWNRSIGRTRRGSTSEISRRP
jgi:hypothetical protein